MLGIINCLFLVPLHNACTNVSLQGRPGSMDNRYCNLPWQEILLMSSVCIRATRLNHVLTPSSLLGHRYYRRTPTFWLGLSSLIDKPHLILVLWFLLFQAMTQQTPIFFNSQWRHSTRWELTTGLWLRQSAGNSAVQTRRGKQTAEYRVQENWGGYIHVHVHVCHP